MAEFIRDCPVCEVSENGKNGKMYDVVDPTGTFDVHQCNACGYEVKMPAKLMERMTRNTVANINACDKYGFDKVEGAPGVMVWIEKSGNRQYVCGASGPLVYADAKKARRNVMRLRNMEPTY